MMYMYVCMCGVYVYVYVCVRVYTSIRSNVYGHRLSQTLASTHFLFPCVPSTPLYAFSSLPGAEGAVLLKT